MVFKRKKLILLAVLAVLCYGCVGVLRKMTGTCTMEYDITKIQQAMEPLGGGKSGQYPEVICDYSRHFGLDLDSQVPGVAHHFGTFNSEGYDIAAHLYLPQEYKAVVFLMHGYLNHCGQLKHVIRMLLDNGYAVAACDMPGHGLSTGERASIDDFAEYETVLTDLIAVVNEQTHGPCHIIAFSQGACVPIGMLLGDSLCGIDKVVLAAPLVRQVAWKNSKLAYKLYKPFKNAVPRVQRRNSSNEVFREFNRKSDYLHATDVPLKWVKALFDWNDRVESLEPCKKPVFVIQGSKDSTVDWKYNIKFINKKFADVETAMIDGARHELFNESAELRNEVFQKIIEYLNDG